MSDQQVAYQLSQIASVLRNIEHQLRVIASKLK
jgi:hypothetical protein